MYLGWTTEEDEFVCVYAVNLPYIDSNTFLAPRSRPDDGIIWMLIVRKEATKVSICFFKNIVVDMCVTEYLPVL